MAFRWYQAKLKTAPLLTQSITTAVLFATGDVMAQQGVEKRGVDKHDLMRTGRMAAYGGALFLSSMAYLEGASPRQRLRDAYLPGLTKNFMVWPWVQFTNFKYVPMEHRVLVVNVVSLGWNCYLSGLNAGGGGGVKEKGKEGGELPPS
ncbi:hypothetical protein P153DRAFT_424112 [Dothidotthia symphoricarpi CBS 119687]|uniref:Uncharacterized protein n=1 Tax=Dothidotthia symphoricarpi CBS 119687 TaxID=1392245 RepID=A0A6A6ABG4_9PLEO|nr:uncharacterized protein P153DRAFT_424112 [Dothidotthia symphoricarpi CBS 119687]KAF2128218.1 hypothetical protein P153DRAFT_424112 [Dothidotthia symphoricarpi CBS 119687]